MNTQTHTHNCRAQTGLTEVVLDRKVRHLHVAEIESREEVHRLVWELSETDFSPFFHFKLCPYYITY